MLHLCFAAGLRVSELVGMRLDDVQLRPHPSVLVHGKGRRERCLPLWKETTSALRAWIAVRGPVQVPELFLNAHGEPMTRSGFEYILQKHVRTAASRCPSLANRRISPHVLSIPVRLGSWRRPTICTESPSGLVMRTCKRQRCTPGLTLPSGWKSSKPSHLPNCDRDDSRRQMR